MQKKRADVKTDFSPYFFASTTSLADKLPD